VRLRVGTGETVMLTGPVVEAAGLAASVAWTVTVDVPAVVGVPVRVQPEPRLNPAGKVPPVMEQL
jgi:hypothetical protein